MKIHRSLISWLIPSAGLRAALLLVSVIAIVSAAARAQTIFVANGNGTNGVSSYNIDGTLINSSLVSGDGFKGLALSGSTLYISDASSGAASIRTATLNGSGGVSSTGFAAIGEGATGLNSPYGLALTATNMYIVNFNTGNVFKYTLGGAQLGTVTNNNINGGANPNPYGLAIYDNTLFVSQATTGTGLNTIKGFDLLTMSSTPTITITTDLSYPHGLAVSGTTLYVANGLNGTITTYNATTGASTGTVISGLTGPSFITVYGSSLFVTGTDGTVKGFDTSNSYAALAGFTTITGLSNPYGIVVGSMSAVPEPSTYAAIAGAAVLGLAVWHRRRRQFPAVVVAADAAV